MNKLRIRLFEKTNNQSYTLVDNCQQKCKFKDKLDLEYTLQDMNKPMGIDDFKYSELPKTIRQNMPTVEELENELKRL